MRAKVAVTEPPPQTFSLIQLWFTEAIKQPQWKHGRSCCLVNETESKG